MLRISSKKRFFTGGFIWRRFRREAHGNVAIIAALSFAPMLVLAGGAVDVARFEAYRVEIQDSADRGVLAAASLSQTMGAEATVRAYLRPLAVYDGLSIAVSSDIKASARKVTAEVSYAMPTSFLGLIGMKTMTVSVLATAQEAIGGDVEISLMLDVSGSMIHSNRIGIMKNAAKDFIDLVLAKNRDRTSISIVPYAGMVSVGASAFNALGGKRDHNSSSCFEFDLDELKVGSVTFKNRKQVPHFTMWNFDAAPLNPGWCPSDNTAISYLSNDPVALKNRIEGYQMYDGTGTAYAAFWGLKLLDPAMRSAISTMGAPAKFASRPANFNAASTLKYMVLMTDGAITDQYRPKKSNQKITDPPSNSMLHGKVEVRDAMYKVCKAAKDNGVTVYTIGFHVYSHIIGGDASTEMRTCASSPAHYYEVGNDIAEAFKAIARQIQNAQTIRLTK